MGRSDVPVYGEVGQCDHELLVLALGQEGDLGDGVVDLLPGESQGVVDA